MKSFFNVIELSQVFEYIRGFPTVATENVSILESLGRTLAKSVSSRQPLPAFPRATMDGYAVRAASTFGASETNPAYLTVTASVPMGQAPSVSLGPGDACQIATGGMLPDGADSVVMVEHSTVVDESTIEVYRSVAPGQHVLAIGEDVPAEEPLLVQGREIRPQEIGLLAAIGLDTVEVYKKPTVAVISTGDEIVPIQQTPTIGQIRDVNTFSLSAKIAQIGGLAAPMGIVADDPEILVPVCRQAVDSADMVLISGGSSVGARDYTIDVIQSLPESEIYFHGVSIRPGKPTLLGKVQNKAVWGLPGQVTSAMVVFDVAVTPCIQHISGRREAQRTDRFPPYARLTRNIASAQGRTDFIRVKLIHKDHQLWAEPILGKSGLINTMLHADGYVKIDANTEGLDIGVEVPVILM